MFGIKQIFQVPKIKRLIPQVNAIERNLFRAHEKRAYQLHVTYDSSRAANVNRFDIV